RFSVLPAISLSGVLGLEIVERSFKGVDFNAFITSLLDSNDTHPHPGPNSVFVMDNASIHKSALL
ncbi:hypothetical protein BDZ89DRAFT_937254, partial [Hymenopellis radicata]